MVKSSPSTPPADAPPRWGTVKEAMAYARCSRTKIYELLNEGRIDGYKDPTRPGGPTYIDLDSIDKMKASFVKYAPTAKAAKSPTQEI